MLRVPGERLLSTRSEETVGGASGTSNTPANVPVPPVPNSDVESHGHTWLDLRCDIAGDVDPPSTAAANVL
ncbi:hypothetical protein [Natrinema gelatinilyticum]|uniref:hypothetical protein n=1 Tax=Natrinema gelatinilyticum TaxID=2961571 RepID=UPI0020C1FEFF|nr:hypothetical protein [Natrinema gelatinilyticum]